MYEYRVNRLLKMSIKTYIFFYQQFKYSGNVKIKIRIKKIRNRKIY